VVGFVNSLPVNGTLYFLQLGSVLQRFVTDGLVLNQGTIQQTIVSPVGDLIPPLGTSLRMTTSNVQILP
jgi:hypothetical protein